MNYLGNHVSKVGNCIGKVLATNKQTHSANINIDYFMSAPPPPPFVVIVTWYFVTKCIEGCDKFNPNRSGLLGVAWVWGGVPSRSHQNTVENQKKNDFLKVHNESGAINTTPFGLMCVYENRLKILSTYVFNC